MRCPICGEESKTTSIICPKHTEFEYDKDRHLVAYTTLIEVTPCHHQSKRIQIKRQVVNHD